MITDNPTASRAYNELHAPAAYVSESSPARKLDAQVAEIILGVYTTQDAHPIIDDPRAVKTVLPRQPSLALEFMRAGLDWTPGRPYSNEDAMRDALDARLRAVPSLDADIDFAPEI